MKKQNSKSNFFYFTLFSVIVILIEGIFFLYCLFLLFNTALAIRNEGIRFFPEFQYVLFWVLNSIFILIGTNKFFSYLEKKLFPSKFPQFKNEPEIIEQKQGSTFKIIQYYV